ncbi:MAG: aldehyde dehydrogenase family protein [Acidobacteria bacterium]|nr:aldehyde dehydrogenase family protein [Acidobacteriota bacterium]
MSQTAEPVVKTSPPALREKYHCLIGGKLVGAESGETFPSFNPATGEKLADVPACDARDIDRAAQAAQNAFPAWRKLSPAERGTYCRRFAERLRARKDVYAALDTLDLGSPFNMMRVDVASAANQIDYYAGLGSELKGETIPSGAQTFSFTLREPFGVVAKITPFNHPIMFAARVAAPLVAGNTLIVKPAEQTPISALEMVHDLKEIFPPGVVNVVSGDGPSAGAPLVQHALVRRIAFTGSVEVGRAIMRSAADGLKTVSLELGGKNPMIVFPDVDLDRAVASAFNGMNYTWSQGQSCGSTSRVFLHSDIHDAFVVKLLEKVKTVRIGMPIDEKTEMGCLVSEQQFNKVMSYIEIGKKEGAKVMIGGGRPSNPDLQRGYFVEPTIFDGVEQRMRLAQEEIFGPVQSIITWNDLDQVTEMANSVMYGLTASIWCRDFSKAYRMAQEIQAGFVWINDSSKHFLGVPFGGYKQSGLGREECLADLLSYTQVKSINVNVS